MTGANGAKAPSDARLPVGRLTASKLALAKKCPGSFAIGHVQTDTGASNRGIQIHSFLEHLLIDGQLRFDLVPDPQARAVCTKISPLEAVNVARAGIAGPVEVLAEIKFAVSADATEARILPESADPRDYSAAPEGWVCGTADAVVVSEHEKAVAITDWKTGSRAVAPPEENLQLRFHALAAALVFGVERVIVQIAYVETDGSIHPSFCEFGSQDLDAIASELREITAEVAGAGGAQGNGEDPPTFVVGEHCRYCPAFSSCPAQAGAAQALLEEKTDELTPQTAAAAWERLVAVEAATRKVRKALGDYLNNLGEGIPLAEGGELGISVSRRDTLEPGVAMPILRERYGERADGAVSVTKKGLQSVAGDEAPDVLKEIEEKDGVRTTYPESLRETQGRKRS